MRRAHALLLAAWVVTLGADRVNLLDGLVPFVFTPFLALTPLVIVSEWMRRARIGARVTISRSGLQYAVVAAALLAVVWASVTVAHGVSYSASRATLLTAQVAGTLAVVVLAADRDDFIALLARASVAGIALYLAADVAQLGAMFGWLPSELRAGPMTLSLRTVAYDGVIPRLSGLVADPNRTGWVLLVAAWFVVAGERRPALRRVAIVAAAAMIVMTLSRSTLLATATALGLVAVTRRRLRVRVGSLATASVLAGLLGVTLFLLPAGGVQRFDALEPLAGRFSSTEASAREHVLVLERGLEEATSSVPRFTLGMGYGNSYLVLQDRFPGNVYANFHSLYVSLLAESGVGALLCLLLLIGWPLARGGPWRPLVAGAAVFNIFYQISAEPAFWLVLVLAWTISEIPARTPPPTG